MLKRTLQVLALLMGVPVLLSLAWLASNARDAEPQPRPAALALQPVPAADGLLSRMATAPRVNEPPPQSLCPQRDCLAGWTASRSAWRQWTAAAAALGAQCERVMADPAVRLGETLAVPVRVDAPLPSFSAATHCFSWWQGLALAAERSDEALHALQQAERIVHLLLAESRLLVGHQTGLSLAARLLQTQQVLAPAHAGLREAMATMAQRLDGPTLLAATRRWVPHEAAYGQAVIDSIRVPALADGAWTWLWSQGFQPEFMKQLMDQSWVRTLEALQGDDPQAALARVRPVFTPEPGVLGPQFRWRHTVAHILQDVAAPARLHAFERLADLHLAAQTQARWLRGQEPPTSERLQRDAAGAWVLQPHVTESIERLPTRWPPLT